MLSLFGIPLRLAVMAGMALAVPAPSNNLTPLGLDIMDLAARQAAGNTSTTAGPKAATDLMPVPWIQSDFPIHESCNGSQRMQLRHAFNDMNDMLDVAAQHILLYGNNSELFIKYFGAQGNPAVPLGFYTKVRAADKSGLLFRCDDVDGNCATQYEDGIPWHGHWRGENATGETVICEVSFAERLRNEKMCSSGFTMANGDITTYWATDLLHRSLHMPGVSNGAASDEAEGYSGSIEIAKKDPEVAAKSFASLQMFAFDVFVRTHLDPQGCVGEKVSKKSKDETPAKDTKDSMAGMDMAGKNHTR